MSIESRNNFKHPQEAQNELTNLPEPDVISSEWRRVVSIGDEISFEAVGLDVANSPLNMRECIINDWLANISETLCETSSTGEWYESIMNLNKYLDYKKFELINGKE